MISKYLIKPLKTDMISMPLILDHIKKSLQLKKNDYLIELGCGDGELTNHLAKEVNTVVAYDFKINKEKTAHSPKNIEYVEGDIRRLSTYDCSCNKLLCYSVLQYLPSQADTMQILGEINRVTKENSLVMLGDLPLDGVGTFQDRLNGYTTLGFTVDKIKKMAERNNMSCTLLEKHDKLPFKKERFDVLVIK